MEKIRHGKPDKFVSPQQHSCNFFCFHVPCVNIKCKIMVYRIEVHNDNCFCFLYKQLSFVWPKHSFVNLPCGIWHVWLFSSLEAEINCRKIFSKCTLLGGIKWKSSKIFQILLGWKELQWFVATENFQSDGMEMMWGPSRISPSTPFVQSVCYLFVKCFRIILMFAIMVIQLTHSCIYQCLQRTTAQLA